MFYVTIQFLIKSFMEKILKTKQNIYKVKVFKSLKYLCKKRKLLRRL